MAQPGEGIGADLKAMRSDAVVWEAAADSLNAPLNALSSLDTTAYEVSMWAALRGMDRTLNDARDSLETIVRQAADYFREIGTDLRDAADQYQRDDEQGLHEIQNSYRIQGDLYDG